MELQTKVWLGGLFLLVNCGAKLHPVEFEPLAAVPTKDNSQVQPFQPEPVDVDPSKACDYWASLTVKANDEAPVFRLADKIDWDAKNSKIVALQNLSHLPEIRYALSKEYNGGKKPIDPPNIDEFMALAKAKRDAGEITGVQYAMLSTLYALGMKSQLIGYRNQAIQDAVEANIPGAFTAAEGPIDQAQIFLDLKKYLNLNRAWAQKDLEYLSLVAAPKPLFVSANWSERRKDLLKTMAILAAPAISQNSESSEEKTCRFSLAHRLMAQILRLKGFDGVPDLKADGTLVAIPRAEVAIFPEHREDGIYGLVVNKDWINAELQKPKARPLGLEHSYDYLEYLRFVNAWTQNRSLDLWLLPDESNANGEFKLPSSLLQLGLGLFGITIKVFAQEELQLSPEGAVKLREDSIEGLVLLSKTGMEIEDSFATLTEPNPLEFALIPDDSIHAFIDPYPVGLVAQMNKLQYALIFEGFNRLQTLNDASAIERLKGMIRNIGRRIKNDTLANLP